MAKKKKGPKLLRLENDGEHRKQCQAKQYCVICTLAPRFPTAPTIGLLKTLDLYVRKAALAIDNKQDAEVVKNLTIAWKLDPLTCACFLERLSEFNEVIARHRKANINNLDAEFLYASLTLATSESIGGRAQEPTYLRARAFLLMDTSKLLPALRDLDKCLQLFPRASSLDLTKPQTWEKNKEMLQHVEWISWRCMGDVEVHLASREKEKRNKHRKTGKDGVDPGAHWVRAIGCYVLSLSCMPGLDHGDARYCCIKIAQVALDVAEWTGEDRWRLKAVMWRFAYEAVKMITMFTRFWRSDEMLQQSFVIPVTERLKRDPKLLDDNDVVDAIVALVDSSRDDKFDFVARLMSRERDFQKEFDGLNKSWRDAEEKKAPSGIPRSKGMAVTRYAQIPLLGNAYFENLDLWKYIRQPSAQRILSSLPKSYDHKLFIPKAPEPQAKPTPTPQSFPPPRTYNDDDDEPPGLESDDSDDDISPKWKPDSKGGPSKKVESESDSESDEELAPPLAPKLVVPGMDREDSDSESVESDKFDYTGGASATHGGGGAPRSTSDGESGHEDEDMASDVGSRSEGVGDEVSTDANAQFLEQMKKLLAQQVAEKEKEIMEKERSKQEAQERARLAQAEKQRKQAEEAERKKRKAEKAKERQAREQERLKKEEAERQRIKQEQLQKQKEEQRKKEDEAKRKKEAEKKAKEEAEKKKRGEAERQKKEEAERKEAERLKREKEERERKEAEEMEEREAQARKEQEERVRLETMQPLLFSPLGEEHEILTCAVCGTEETEDMVISVCGGCKSRRYCSRRCQKRDWKILGHNTFCGKLGEAAVVSGVA